MNEPQRVTVSVTVQVGVEMRRRTHTEAELRERVRSALIGVGIGPQVGVYRADVYDAELVPLTSAPRGASVG